MLIDLHGREGPLRTSFMQKGLDLEQGKARHGEHIFTLSLLHGLDESFLKKEPEDRSQRRDLER